MSALTSLERFGEENPFFHKLKIIQTLITKAFTKIHLLIFMHYLENQNTYL